jgi:non-ribosomal peptide synthetase component F
MSKQASEQAALKSVGQLAECHGEPLPDIHHSMWEMFNSTATKYPERDAIISLWQLPIVKSQSKQLEKQSDNLSEVDSVLRWSYAELQLRVEHLAGWLQSQDCAEGENLVCISRDYYCTYF